MRLWSFMSSAIAVVKLVVENSRSVFSTVRESVDEFPVRIMFGKFFLIAILFDRSLSELSTRSIVAVDRGFIFQAWKGCCGTFLSVCKLVFNYGFAMLYFLLLSEKIDISTAVSHAWLKVKLPISSLFSVLKKMCFQVRYVRIRHCISFCLLHDHSGHPWSNEMEQWSVSHDEKISSMENNLPARQNSCWSSGQLRFLTI